jgi:hypothetical protein
MTRQTYGLAAKTGLIEALRPAGYEFETGETDSGVATGLRRPFPRRKRQQIQRAGAATHPA